MSTPCLPVSHRRKRKHFQVEVADDGIAPKKSESCNDENDHNSASFVDIQNMDAAEYLSRVVDQAKMLPPIFEAGTVKDRDTIPEKHRNHVAIEGSAASLSYLVSGRASLTKPPSTDHLPRQIPEWIEVTLKNFERLRDYLDDCRTQGIGGKLTTRVAFPPMKDRAGWHLFCVGEDEARGNANSYFAEDYDKKEKRMDDSAGEGDDTQMQDLPAWRNAMPAKGYTPSVQLLTQMDQVLVRRVISHLSHYTCQGWALTEQRSAWIYALLARLEKPVHRDDASTLFGLLKVLTLSRSKQAMEREKNRLDLARLNLLITLIGVFFEQGARTVMSIS